MPSIRITQQVPANGTIANLLQGSPFEFAPNTQEVEIAATEEAGAGPNKLVVDVQFGSEIQMEGANIATEASAGAGPRLPDNVLVSDFAAPGDRLTVRARETSGVATNITLFVRTVDA